MYQTTLFSASETTPLCPVCNVNPVVSPHKYCSHRCYSQSRRHTPETFWKHVLKTEGCWLWQGDTSDFGYGRCNYHHHIYHAHRLAWILTHGDVPSGKLVLHKCDNPPCCNPDHLYIGTYADNARDAVERGRIAKGEDKHVAKGDDHYSHRTPEKCLRGEKHGMSKLTAEKVVSIRKRFSSGEPARQLAIEYGVDRTLIYMIIRRQIWVHIP